MEKGNGKKRSENRGPLEEKKGRRDRFSKVRRGKMPKVERVIK